MKMANPLSHEAWDRLLHAWKAHHGEPTMDAMTPKLDNSIDRLIKMMGMTTSDNDGQALVALRAANALLKKLNTDWDAVLRGKISIIADPFGDIPVVQQAPKPPPEPPRPTPQQTPGPWSKPAPNPFRRTQGSAASPQGSHTTPGAAPGFGGAFNQSPPRAQRITPAWPKSKEIDGFFAILSLRKYSNKIQDRIVQARDRYTAQGGLHSADYMYIHDLAQKQGIGSIADL